MCASERFFDEGELYNIYQAKEISGEDWGAQVSIEIRKKYNQLSEESKIKFNKKFAKSVEENKDRFASMPQDVVTKKQYEDQQGIIKAIAYRVVNNLDDFLCKTAVI